MFREMRRKRQLLSQEAIQKVLYQGTSGVLAVSGDDAYPYAFPLIYVYDGEKIYFHSAKSGHKIDAVSQNPRASFCVIDQDQIVPEEYTTYFRSVIVFGRMRVIEDEAEMRKAIEKLSIKYAPEDTTTSRDRAIRREWDSLCMLELNIDHMTGKEAVELMKEKQQG